MTAQELYDKLGTEIKCGHGDLRVIANCEFDIKKRNCYGVVCEDTHYDDFYLTELDDVYYQSGDIELGFCQK